MLRSACIPNRGAPWPVLHTVRKFPPARLWERMRVSSSSSRNASVAAPVNPGHAASFKPSCCGRGPTKDISPFSTFQNWGSSSSLYLRKTAPTGVMRESPLSVIGEPDCCCISIERNLQSTNSRPSRPIRRCRKSAGPSRSEPDGDLLDNSNRLDSMVCYRDAFGGSGSHLVRSELHVCTCTAVRWFH